MSMTKGRTLFGGAALRHAGSGSVAGCAVILSECDGVSAEVTEEKRGRNARGAASA